MKKKSIQTIITLIVSSSLMFGTINAQAADGVEESNSKVEIEERMGLTDSFVSDEADPIEESGNMGIEGKEPKETDSIEAQENEQAESEDVQKEESETTTDDFIKESAKENSEEVITVQTIDTQIVRPQEVTDLKAQVVNWNQVKLTWTESDAEGYIIYRKTSSQDKFSYCYMVKNGSFVDTKAERGSYNFYRVYPYNTDSSGKRILGKSTAYVYAKPGVGPTAVSGLKATLQYSNYVQLTWNPSKEAEGYLIYRKTEYEEKFTYRYMVKGTSFMDNTAWQGIYNYYRIYPYYTDSEGKRVVGASTTYVYVKPIGVATVNNLQLSVDTWDGSIWLAWDYISSQQTIDGFIIYRKVGNGGNFKYLDSIKSENGWFSTYYNDTTASVADYNFYKVYAYSVDANGKKRIGPCTSYVYGKATIPAVYGLTPIEQIDQVRLLWEKNNNADVDGYDIYRKQGNGGFTYIASTQELEYIDRSASKDEVNFYRVYPYKIINGKRVTGLSNTYVYGRSQYYSRGQEIADYGWQFRGTPYVWGGNDLTTGVDCSGFTSQVYAHFGIILPRVAAAQAESGVDIGRDISNAQPGDIITYCYNLNEEACHASIYVGSGRILHSTTTHLYDGTVIDGIQIGYAGYMTIKSIRRYY